MSFTLTGKEIMDAAIFAGFEINEKSKADLDLYETEFTIISRSDGDNKFMIYCSEYPEEGGVEIGE